VGLDLGLVAEGEESPCDLDLEASPVVGIFGFGESPREELDGIGKRALAIGLIPGFLTRGGLLG